MSSPRRSTRQHMSRTPGSRNGAVSDVASAAGRGKVILVSEHTPTRSAKRTRQPNSDTSRRTSTRLAEGSVVPKKDSTQRSSRGARATVAAFQKLSSDDEDDPSRASSSENDLLASIKKKPIGEDNSFVHKNAFDVYFDAAAKPSPTSNNVFSQLVPPLSPEEYARLLRTSPAVSKNAAEFVKMREAHEALFARYAFELSEGFNLLFFGFGSKRTILNSFARTVCSRLGHVVIINAFQPRVSIRDLLACIENASGLADVPLSSSPDAQACRIYNFFLPPAVRPADPTASRPLFIVIHNIDAPSMRSPRAKATLSLLAMNPRIHLIASIDHIHAQTLWSLTEATARKHQYTEATPEIPPMRGFAWIWHDLTTMEHYDAELAHIDVTRPSGRTGKATATTAEREMTETAAQHILASVNAKAKKLFALLARTLLDMFQTSPSKSEQIQGVQYSSLFNAARADFIATNDTSFRALLAEFRDHNLVISNLSNVGETLRIPLQPEELRRLLKGLLSEQ